MPVSSNSKDIGTAHDVLSNLHAIAGPQPGFRPAHAHGALLTGTFQPSKYAAKLTSAPHFNKPSTPVTVRFSTGTGNPHISDTDPNAMPRGMATRFHLGENEHTDIVTHSTPFFPVKTGEEFLEFTQAIIDSQSIDPEAMDKFNATHPASLANGNAPKPSPHSFATQTYFSVTAFKFVPTSGDGKYFRYRWIPTLGQKTYTNDELKSKSSTYLYDELAEHIKRQNISFKLVAQIANASDVTNDATIQWPEDRQFVELGSVTLDEQLSDAETLKDQKQMIFIPVPRVRGLEASDDPLLDFRWTVYTLSGKERRAA